MMKIPVVKNILKANQQIANENRQLFVEKGIYVMNLMSSPGAGKTSLLERTLNSLKDRYRMAVIEGDIQDTCDSDRIAALDIPAIQINTGGACHLDATMILQALSSLNLDNLDILIVENVGNLVCPAEFDIGENDKIMILSVSEGDDKPHKYPLMFSISSALLINKTDLLPYVNFNMKIARETIKKLRSDIEIFDISCRNGTGLDVWYDWLTRRVDAVRAG
jgi:hydrogenase nickel incorporation protein HypB